MQNTIDAGKVRLGATCLIIPAPPKDKIRQTKP